MKRKRNTNGNGLDVFVGMNVTVETTKGKKYENVLFQRITSVIASTIPEQVGYRELYFVTQDGDTLMFPENEIDRLSLNKIGE